MPARDEGDEIPVPETLPQVPNSYTNTPLETVLIYNAYNERRENETPHHYD